MNRTSFPQPPKAIAEKPYVLQPEPKLEPNFLSALAASPGEESTTRQGRDQSYYSCLKELSVLSGRTPIVPLSLTVCLIAFCSNPETPDGTKTSIEPTGPTAELGVNWSNAFGVNNPGVVGAAGSRGDGIGCTHR